MINRFATLLATLTILTFQVPRTQAADLTFDFSTLPTFQATYVMTNGAYTLTLLNPVGSSDTPGFFSIDPDGISLWPQYNPNPGFSMQISGGPLDFKNYVVGFINPGSVGSFALSGGTGSSTGNAVNPTGTFAFNGPYSIAPGQTVVLTSTISGAGDATLSQIKSITFSTPVPEPSTYALGAIATGVMAFAARRRRSRLA